MASCHPERKHHAGGLCQPCYRNAHYKAGHTGPPKPSGASHNSEEKREYMRKWRAKNADRIRAYRKQYHRPHRMAVEHGISLEQYDLMLAAQGNGCAICGGPPGGQGQMHVDHNHTTGAIRGLLCSACNMGLGLLKDNPATLRAAATYLELHK